jgi:hypothetical protein
MSTSMAVRALFVSLGIAVSATPALAIGEYPSSAPGRYVAMVSPTNGESFVTPLNLRLVAIGHDDNIYTNEPVPGKGTNATKVQFYLDDTLIYEQNGTDAEYHVFKGFVENLNVTPGTHTIRARATYTNVTPTLYLDSAPFTITVSNPPAYAQTVNLSANVVLSGSQSYELVGSASGRIRLNGNGYRITASGTSGHLTLKFVDVYDLGSASNTGATGLDVTTTGTVTIEDTVFDHSNAVAVRLNGSATASIVRNVFRSNMRMPVGQQPEGPDTIPAITLAGSSSAAKTFAANNVGAAPVRFDHAKNWTIGGSHDEDTNILIGPRAAFEVLESTNMTMRGNFVHHNYYGGWSQGQLMELHGSTPILVEHNVLYDSSWPVRGIAGELRYNLILEAGHEWIVPGNNAYIHHNIFVGGDNDRGGITGYYDVTARIESNTFDGLSGNQMRAGIMWQMGSTTLKSNAFTRIPTGAVGAIERTGGTITADYNGFFNAETTNYTDGSTPAHDLHGGAQTNPNFAGPLPAKPFDLDEVKVWQRTLLVSAILNTYRARYTPTTGSAYIDAGDPAGGAGNDIGAIGAGTANAADLFGDFGDQSGAGDTDGDGLSNTCEDDFGLDPNSAAGDNGAAGDPDHDGRTNLQECTDGTHPRGFHARYLAEGAVNDFFDVRLALLNVGNASAAIQLRFLQPGGTTVSLAEHLAPGVRRTITRNDLTSLTSADFSTVLESDQPVVIDRTMTWDASGYGSHAETGVLAPSNVWYFAEGSTSAEFSLFYLLQNPNPSALVATVRYLLPFGQAPVVKTYDLPPFSRTTIPVDDQGAVLASTDVSAVIETTGPIVAERAMYRSTSNQAFAAGHESAGVTAPATHWFLAEGATGPFFDCFLLLANPNPQGAAVTVDYLLSDGSTFTKTYSVPGESRFTIWVDDEQIPADSGIRPLDNVAVSSTVTSTIPIIVERTMWWPGPGMAPTFWTEAHNSPGVTETGTAWAMAEGEVGGARSTETYVLIANTSATAGEARVTLYFDDGTTAVRVFPLGAKSRTNVNVSADFPEAVGKMFGTTVESLGTTPAQIVVERAMYSNAGGVAWAAGTNAVATRLR